MVTRTTIEEERQRERSGSSISPPIPGELESSDLTLFDLYLPLAQKRKLIARMTAGVAMVGLIIALFTPNKYIAVTKILPPQQAQSSLSSMLGQLGALANLAGGASMLGLKNPAELYVGILKSRDIADAVILQFDLKNQFKEKTMASTREDLESHTVIEASKDGIISVAYEDKDPKQAAAIANAYVAHLYEANQRLAVSEASQRRLFFEKELAAEKDALANAEVELKKTQEKTGLIQLGSQADAIIRAAASLKAQIIMKQVQLEGAKSFGTDENPVVQRLQQELAAQKAQLSKLENDQKIGAGNIQIPTGKVPEVGLEYARRFRDVKYHEVLFEIFAKQFEAAKIDEGKNAPVIQVVDVAVPPDRKSGPHRTLMVLLYAFAGLALSCVYIWSSTYLSGLRSELQMQMLRDRS